MIQENRSKRINAVLLAAYLSFIIVCQLWVNDGFTRFRFAAGSCLTIVFSAFAAPVLLRFAASWHIAATTKGAAHTGAFRIILYYIIPLLVFILYYLAYYPGGFCPDWLWQYRQAVTNRYDDWHPVLHTLFAIKLPLVFSRGRIGATVWLHILLFSAALGYSFCVMERCAGRSFTSVAMAFLLLNPMTGSMAVFPWKDTTFAIGALALLTFALRIYNTKGEWLKKLTNSVTFVIVFLLTTFCRHNAVLFTVPLLIAVLLQVTPKRSLVLVLVIAGMIFAVKGPLYTALDVHKPSGRRVELLGMPMTVIGAAVKYAPEKTDEDVLEFAYRIAPKELWEEFFNYGDFNTLKYRDESNENVIEAYGSRKVLNMAWRCLNNSPYVCGKSFIKLVEGVFTLTDPHSIGVVPYITENPYGIKRQSLCPPLLEQLQVYRAFIHRWFPRLFLYYGTAHLVLLVSVLAKCDLSRIQDGKRILFALPVFFYNFGTALLLTGYSDVPRFFYNAVVLLPVLLLFFYQERGATP